MAQLSQSLDQAAAILRIWGQDNAADAVKDARFMLFPKAKAVASRRMVAIVERVSAERNVSVEDIMGRSREPEIAYARQYAMFRCRVECGASYPQIGKHFDRDHTTVMHAIRKMIGANGG